MNIIDFRDAQAARETPAPRRISDDALANLRLQAEFNANTTGAKSWRDLVNALVELQDRREEEKW